MLTVGIDINDNTVRLVGLRKTKTNYCVATFAVGDAKTPALALKKAISAAAIKIKAAAIAIPYSAIMLKTVALDASLQESDILHYLATNTAQATGINPHNLCMDFKILGPTKAQPNKIDVALVAAKREPIDFKVALLREAKIKVTAVDVETFAIARAMSHQSKNDTIAIINLNPSSFLLCILHNKTIIYAKENNIHSIAPQKISQLLNSELQIFVTTHNQIIKQIILTGNVDQFPAIETISTQINMPVNMTNPLFNLQLASHLNQAEFKRIAPGLILSYGLALRQ